ncbi:hypothetical protein [Pedobacter nyackensis]|nr:hypothetical protein [Pedobacter nyackensis]
MIGVTLDRSFSLSGTQEYPYVRRVIYYGTIAKALLNHNYNHDRIIGFMGFLKNFIFINNNDINRIFDQQIEILTGGTINMGIIETIKMQERREGKLEGRLEGKLEEALEIARELKKEGLAIDFIAKTTRLSIKEIEVL